MPDRIDYYSVVGVGRTIGNPSGLARRRYMSDGRIDESLRRDLSWGPSTAITDWEYGNHPGDLIAITEDEARVLIERFREKWKGES